MGKKGGGIKTALSFKEYFSMRMTLLIKTKFKFSSLEENTILLKVFTTCFLQKEIQEWVNLRPISVFLRIPSSASRLALEMCQYFESFPHIAS